MLIKAPGPTPGFLLADSGKAPETYCHIIEWQTEDGGGFNKSETFARRSSAMQALHRLSETDGITFLSYARRFA